MKRLFALLLALAPLAGVWAQQEMTSTQAKALYKATSKKWVSVHDPSVVWEPNQKRYYIFGSHKDGAYTTDLQNWTQANPTWTPSANNQAFVTPQVKKVKKGGVEVDLPAFNAMEWSARTDASYNINGNMWAPDVIWNPTMKKWCMYLSINGDAWHSSIVLLTSNNITGPYAYQGPVVICGFQDSGHSYKGTDLELVLGTQSSLPSRYNVGSGWGRRWPHTIDPTVFFDQEGKLWMVYGSWSGGIWMLELDEDTGLRDYDVVYPSTGGSTDGVTSDPYFGKKVGGGYYVSGEGSYIEYVGGYYYLFISYGFFDSVGGYVMRVFRSQKPDGPYVDANGVNAIFTSYKMNYGANADTRGVKIMGPYAGWGFMTNGELSQGHNSVIHADDGRTYLVYHTRFNDGSEGHQVRVHQLFQTKTGWLVASPFEYNGEQLTDEDVAQRELFSNDEVTGTYQLLVHKYATDYAKREVVRPVSITLGADGKVSGAYTGTWTRDAGTSYLKLVMGGVTYNGVLVEQQMDKQSIKTIAFSAQANNGLNVWGYRMRDDYALAWQLNNQKEPVIEGQNITRNVDLHAMHQGDANVLMQWTSSQPQAFSDHGRYNPAGLTEPLPVKLTARIEAGNWFWQKDYNATLAAESYPETDKWKTGILAYYNFDGEQLVNAFNTDEKATPRRGSSSAKYPVQEDDALQLRNGKVMHLSFGASGSESYLMMPNPLYGKELASGATISFWVRRTDDSNLWDALYGFYNGSTKARLFMTGNAYTGFNDNAGNWFDQNNPNSVQTNYLSGTRWHLVTVVFNRSTQGVRVYVDGSLKSASEKFEGSMGDKSVTKTSFDYNLLVDHIAKCQYFYLGYGSFWGSADACYDDLLFYDYPISLVEVLALNTMLNRVYDIATGGEPASVQSSAVAPLSQQGRLLDLQGRPVEGSPRPGLYIRGGRKVIVK